MNVNLTQNEKRYTIKTTWCIFLFLRLGVF